jgi:hypothetical protein
MVRYYAARADEYDAWYLRRGRYPDSESGARDHRPPGDDVQVRRLDDGASFRVRKVFYEPVDLESALRRAGFGGNEVVTTDRFFVMGSARLE